MLSHILNQPEPALPTAQVKNHIHKDVYIYDAISRCKIVNDTLKILYIGGKSPRHQVTIFIKGKEPNKHNEFKVGEKWHFSGMVFIYSGKPAITITNSVQLGERIQM